MPDLRSLPSVDQLLQQPAAREWLSAFGRPLTLAAIRSVLAEARARYPGDQNLPQGQALLERIRSRLEDWSAPSLVGVINAAGVVLHTNLGRAPLSRAASAAAQEVALNYANLEYDLAQGQRGSRLVHAEALLTRLTGAESGLVVNNNAAAVLLVLSALARRRAVVIARSQLVEIGGGFRVPEVMKQSGARLLEVGATNRVHLNDYEAALAEKPALFLRAHRSNFRLVGFVGEPGLAEMAELAHRAGLPLVDDLGSGALLDTARYGLEHEPMVQESLAAGADLVCFSGDKLLGGPQAGIIVGRGPLVARLRQHPLARALRADKLCLAALSATLLHYLKDEAEQAVPVWQMIAARPEALEARARRWAEHLGQGEVLAGESTVGGGSLPGETLPTCLLALAVAQPNRFLARLRQAQPPIIARIQEGRVVLDARTVLPGQDAALLAGLQAALAQAGDEARNSPTRS
jgi:L-seryl-tRNA(Ser) seleniumtransferase